MDAAQGQARRVAARRSGHRGAGVALVRGAWGRRSHFDLERLAAEGLLAEVLWRPGAAWRALEPLVAAFPHDPMAPSWQVRLLMRGPYAATAEDATRLAAWSRDARRRAGRLDGWPGVGLSWARLAGSLQAHALLVEGRSDEALAAYEQLQGAPREIEIEGHLAERLAARALWAEALERAGRPCEAGDRWLEVDAMPAEHLNQPWMALLARRRAAALEGVPCAAESR